MTSWFANLKISVKLTISYLILCMLMLCVGAIGIFDLKMMNDDLSVFYNDCLQGVSSIKDYNARILSTRLAVQRMVLPENRNDIPALEAEIQKNVDSANKLLKDYEKTIATTAASTEDKAMFQELQELIAAYRKNRDIVIGLVKAGDYENATYEYKNANAVTATAVVNQLSKMGEFNDTLGRNYIKYAENNFRSAMNQMMSVIGFGLILAMTLGFFLSRSIVKPLDVLVAASNEVAAGNLAKNIQSTRRDEIGQLELAVKSMVSNLRDIIINAKNSAEMVAASSEELTASSEQSAQAANSVATSIMSVAQGAEKQLAIAGETLRTAENMSAGAEQIASNANVVSATSDQTAQAAQRGGSAVETAVNQMASIQNTVESLAKEITGLGMRSKEIGQIVETISGIAAQTNLLALNAAIEAARAGEQGRGFAVVAEEVRKLAEQSGEAAKQISSLIGAIQNDTTKAVQAMEVGTREVRTGSELVDNAGLAFKEIAGLINQTSVQVREISEAIQQMVSDSQNIVEGAQEVNRLSQETAGQTQSVSAATQEQLASMQEIASSSQTLAKRAEDLQTISQRFVT